MMNNELRPYEKYKKSEAGYISCYPDTWDIVKLRFVLEERKEKNKQRQTNNILSVMKDRGVILYSEKGNIGNKCSEDIERYNVVHPDDIVMNCMNVIIGSVGRSKYYGALSQVYYVLKNRDELKYNIKYYENVFKMQSLQKELTKYGKGILAHRMRVPIEMIKNLELPLPPKDEQDQIVKFLEHKLFQINKFIKLKKKLIATLKEQQQEIINEAITKGINSNVNLKQSGVEWIGEIPEHWKVSRCRYLFKEVDERSVNGDEIHLSMSQKLGLVSDDQLEERRLLSESYIGGKICNKDDIVLNRLKAHLGVFALAPHKGVVSPDYTILRSNKEINPKFAELVLKSTRCRRELRIRVRGIVEGFWRLYTDDFYTITLPKPDYYEQIEIVEYIIRKNSLIDENIALIEKELILVSEYRNSLISDVVTGKVDVRNIVIEELEEEIIEDIELDEDSIDEEVLEAEDGDE